MHLQHGFAAENGLVEVPCPLKLVQTFPCESKAIHDLMQSWLVNRKLYTI